MPRGFVKEYDQHTDNHTVLVEPDGKQIFVDLYVNGDNLPSRASIVGKTIEWDRDYPYVSIAEGVRVLAAREGMGRPAKESEE